MISEKTYKKYKALVKYQPTGILHILSGTILYTHAYNTGIGRESRRMMLLHQWLGMMGAFKGTFYNRDVYKVADRLPLVFRSPNSAKSYMGMVLLGQDKSNYHSGYIFQVEDEILASPTESAINNIRNGVSRNDKPRIKRHITEFEFIPMDYDSTMRLYTDHKLTKERLLNEISLYERLHEQTASEEK